MHNIEVLESCFNRFIENVSNWLPEDIVQVDLKMLHGLDLLHYHDPNHNDPGLTRYFHVIESDEKITLVNDDFVVWIVPEKQNDQPVTYTFIAVNSHETPKLQLCFVTSGVYNTSRLVLRLLEKYLFEIQENESLIECINNGMKQT
jgi:hypothetical protein